ncbi:hypothetical protein CEXT_193351 [Caerostris extrusa]|uniref:Uncharacterized protein n=1 Tax=Caerostris extrusa TaxID=172846 RepID=A0AAV4RSU9_CAEEX|nr:hypothetical protein CEXT_193351 [Caerostris extrusa]
MYKTKFNDIPLLSQKIPEGRAAPIHEYKPIYFFQLNLPSSDTHECILKQAGKKKFAACIHLPMKYVPPRPLALFKFIGSEMHTQIAGEQAEEKLKKRKDKMG